MQAHGLNNTENVFFEKIHSELKEHLYYVFVYNHEIVYICANEPAGFIIVYIL